MDIPAILPKAAFAGGLAAALPGQPALAQFGGDVARNLLPMGGDTGHSSVDVRQGLVGGPIVTGRPRAPVAAPYHDPETTGSLQTYDRGKAGTWRRRRDPRPR